METSTMTVETKPKCEIIDYKGRKIVFTDISGARPEDAIPAFERTTVLVPTLGEKGALSLVDAKDARFNTDLISKIKEVVKKNNPYVKATAVCGLSSLTSLMVNSIITFTGRKMKLFDTIEEGKEWLIGQ
ncbi:hypothetical protein OO013_01085 [Mangrovivirga sp. M17]|uniref:STAS/SEC14 domain-containing protein n=1 Tax=Mangrovivirga halotolerans TaxID=2993936 RepID=A0ABT3RMN6_9BACT|nr:hypothetical protein [Mangrovivirga halotolerans]MCX2742435.1 hypothetical protein [Mangrovivirga halotolerans]